MAIPPSAVPTLALQEAVAVLMLGFGLMALRVAPSHGTSTRTAAWFMAGVAFTFDGGLGTLHSTLAVVAVAAGSESGLYAFFMRFSRPGNDARSLLMLGFALGLGWLVLLGGRPRPARPVVAAAGVMTVAGFVVGLVEGPLVRADVHFRVLAVFGASTAVLLFAALYWGMVTGRVDWLLWTALALFAAQEALSSNIKSVLSWAGFSGEWAPAPRSMLWVGLASACVMLVCSARAVRVVGLQRPRLHHSPGSRILGWASFLFSRRDMDEVIEPAITDMRIEYSDALFAGHRAHAWWIRVRGTYGVLATAALLIVARGGRLFATVWRLISK